MFCEKCGKEIPDGVKFCKYCGNNTEDNVSENKSGSASIGNQAMPKDEHKVKKHKRLLIIVIAIAVLALVAASIYLGSHYMMGGEATQEKAIAKSIEAAAYGDLDAYEKAAVPRKYLRVLVKNLADKGDESEDEFDQTLKDMMFYGEETTRDILGDVKKINDIYVDYEESPIEEGYFTRKEINKGIKDFLELDVKIEEVNTCYVTATYTDTNGARSSAEYAYDDEEYDYEDFEDYEEYMQYYGIPIVTYKMNGRWYAFIPMFLLAGDIGL